MIIREKITPTFMLKIKLSIIWTVKRKYKPSFSTKRKFEFQFGQNFSDHS